MPVSRRSATTTITRGVLVVLFAVVLAAAFGTRQLVSNQAQKLLQQRTEELGLVINGLTSSVGAGLSQLAEAAKTGPDPAAAFTAATHLSTSVREEALIRSEGEGVFTVLAAAGPD